MLTAGVDLAADPKRSALVEVEWLDGRGRVVNVACPLDDEEILEAAQRADFMGIDCPFGWPMAFVDFVSQHARRELKPSGTSNAFWRRQFRYRRTDEFTADRMGKLPLSGSTDKLGVVALRMAELEARMLAAQISVERDGSGSVCEVYPGSVKNFWFQLPKPPASTVINQLEWLTIDVGRKLLESNADVFDAFICALI